MKRLFIFPTIDEAKAFILTEPRDPVFIGGVGMAEIAAATLRAVKAKKPDLVILCGVAGAYAPTPNYANRSSSALQRGQVVEVVTERVAGIPARYARAYETTGPETGLPPVHGITVNRTGEGVPLYADQVAQAVDAPSDDFAGCDIVSHDGFSQEGAPQADDASSDDLPWIENMEGAAFFAVCETLGVAACQIRAVSNYVGEPFEAWAVEEAVRNLTETLKQIQIGHE